MKNICYLFCYIMKILLTSVMLSLWFITSLSRVCIIKVHTEMKNLLFAQLERLKCDSNLPCVCHPNRAYTMLVIIYSLSVLNRILSCDVYAIFWPTSILWIASSRLNTMLSHFCFILHLFKIDWGPYPVGINRVKATIIIWKGLLRSIVRLFFNDRDLYQITTVPDFAIMWSGLRWLAGGRAECSVQKWGTFLFDFGASFSLVAILIMCSEDLPLAPTFSPLSN